MAEVLIALQRPASMTDWEIRAWVIEQTRASRRTLVLSQPEDSGSEPLLLRVEVLADSADTAEEQITDLMMDMRLLGLGPTVVSVLG